jgi:hypothetical protein
MIQLDVRFEARILNIQLHFFKKAVLTFKLKQLFLSEFLIFFSILHFKKTRSNMIFTEIPNKNCVSPDGKCKITFARLEEISMGGPLRGDCFLKVGENAPILLHETCGSYPIWQADSSRVFFMIWTNAGEQYRIQKIACYSIQTRELAVFERVFVMLELKKWRKNCLIGILSPFWNSVEISFDLKKEKIESVFQF